MLKKLEKHRTYPVDARFRCLVCGSDSGCEYSMWFVICRRKPSARPAVTGGWVHGLPETVHRRVWEEIRRRRMEALAEAPGGLDRPRTGHLKGQVDVLFANYNRHGPATRKKYYAIWRDLAEFLETRYRLEDLGEVQPAHVEAWLAEMGVSGGERSMRLAAIDAVWGHVPNRLYRGSMREALQSGAGAGLKGDTRLMPQAWAIVRRLNGYSMNTRDRYARVWYRFVEWLEGNTGIQNLKNVRPQDLERYQRHRAAGGLSKQALAWERRVIVAVHRQIEGRRYESLVSQEGGEADGEPGGVAEAGGGDFPAR